MHKSCHNYTHSTIQYTGVSWKPLVLAHCTWHYIQGLHKNTAGHRIPQYGIIGSCERVKVGLKTQLNRICRYF